MGSNVEGFKASFATEENQHLGESGLLHSLCYICSISNEIIFWRKAATEIRCVYSNLWWVCCNCRHLQDMKLKPAYIVDTDILLSGWDTSLPPFTIFCICPFLTVTYFIWDSKEENSCIQFLDKCKIQGSNRALWWSPAVVGLVNK